jgi:hypothetical protein
MNISVTSTDNSTDSSLLEGALAHLRRAIGPLQFVNEPQGDLVLQVDPAGPDWGAWQTFALDPLDDTRAQLAVRTQEDWYPTRASGLLAWGILEATVRLLLGPENVPHPLPKTCLNRTEPEDRVEAFALIRGGYICKGCCEALQVRGVSSFALDQLQEATQLVRALLVRPQHYSPRPGRLRLAERHGKLVLELPDYASNLLLKEPLHVAFYILLLRHREGLTTNPTPAKLDTRTQELANLYRHTYPDATAERALIIAGKLFKPDALKAVVSALNSYVKEQTPTAVHEWYLVKTDKKNHINIRTILLAPELVEDRTGALLS